ncbi:TIGR00159 family protein [Clostridiales bacterium COT073_COT-073]|nr:TIGR00159 family protein [Clostridiales bacterium COT073_COT-073]
MSQFPSIRLKDGFEILIITYVIYKILQWFRGTKAWMLFKGILILLFISVFASIMEFNTILWIFANTINVGIIAIFIIFQPELRRALEQLGRSNFLSSLLSFDDVRHTKENLSEEQMNGIVQAVEEMGKVKTGALIVLEQAASLDEYVKTGIPLDAEVSKELLLNIFEHNTPLHDGAVIIKGKRIAAATCYLPLSENMSISKELGTRHRAGLGLSEVTDAVIIIVSEETGNVSVAIGGNLVRAVDPQYLKNKLFHLFGKKEDVKRYFLWKGFGKNDKKANQ